MAVGDVVSASSCAALTAPPPAEPWYHCRGPATASGQTEVKGNGIDECDEYEHWIDCYSLGALGSSCRCATLVGEFYFDSELTIGDDDYRTCERFHPLCDEPEAFQFLDAAVCNSAPVSANDSTGVCSIARSCDGSAVLDGEPVVAETSARLVCRAEGDAYRCQCDDEFAESFSLSAASLTGACTAALEECPEPSFLRPAPM